MATSASGLLKPTVGVSRLAVGREVVLAVGPPGTGKTHVCTALGLAACRQGRRVRFVTVADLVTELSEAQAKHRLSRLEQQLERRDLLILDELGFVKLSVDQAQLLFILLAHRYTRGALAVTSNLEFSDWTSVFNDDARLVAALLDRLTHRCHLLEFRGGSYRFRQSLATRTRDERLPPSGRPNRPEGGSKPNRTKVRAASQSRRPEPGGRDL
jgi:DNA replication protein DnaC